MEVVQLLSLGPRGDSNLLPHRPELLHDNTRHLSRLGPWNYDLIVQTRQETIDYRLPWGTSQRDAKNRPGRDPLFQIKAILSDKHPSLSTMPPISGRKMRPCSLGQTSVARTGVSISSPGVTATMRPTVSTDRQNRTTYKL
jgi:hypothetical protein